MTALAEIAKMTPPKDQKSYKKKVKQVAKVVSDKLGNKPAEALKSYINPEVFWAWTLTG